MVQLTRQTLASQVAKRIHQKIRHRKLQPGDALGTEFGLAEEFGVSRNIVREAVGRLRALGIVKGKQRIGLVVGQTGWQSCFNKAKRMKPIRWKSNSIA